jgi:hypothetical protein
MKVITYLEFLNQQEILKDIRDIREILIEDFDDDAGVIFKEVLNIVMSYLQNKYNIYTLPFHADTALNNLRCLTKDLGNLFAEVLYDEYTYLLTDALAYPEYKEYFQMGGGISPYCECGAYAADEIKYSAAYREEGFNK